MPQLISYHGDQAVKDKYIARFAEHRRLDQVIQGHGYKDGSGCFVGCTLDAYDHSRFPIELGWPEWLARLADRIFEGIPKEEAPQFGTDLLATVPVGVDLEPVRHLTALRRIDRLIALQQRNLAKHGDAVDLAINSAIAALQAVRRCHEAEIGGDSCDWATPEWATPEWAAAPSAQSAAWAAESAAESAGWLKESSAWSAAAPSAQSAAWAAESAAESAGWATPLAQSAAWEEAYCQERDDLLSILRELK